MENLNRSVNKLSLNNRTPLTTTITTTTTTTTVTTCKHETQPTSDANIRSGNTNHKSCNSFKASAHTTSWLEALQVQQQHNNNNNNNEVKEATLVNSHCIIGDSPKVQSCATWQYSSCDSHILSYPDNLREEDEGGGDSVAVGKKRLLYNGSDCKEMPSDSTVASHLETDFGAYDLCGAVSLTPPLMWEDQYGSGSAAAAAGGGTSNRTSLNNSTENLSYISDSFYADDVLILGEDGDAEAEEISLNSDDCVYAYRGEGADFDLPLESIDNRLCNMAGLPTNSCAEEETDFLEMDFEPDPLSELEFNHTNPNVNANPNPSLALNMSSLNSALIPKTQYQQHHHHHQQRQLFSSPINDLTAPVKGLQTQAMLSKNFARITLHLDQIQRDYQEDADKADKLHNGRRDDTSCVNCYQRDKPEMERLLRVSKQKCHQNNTTAFSLPNTLYEHFGNRSVSESAVGVTAAASVNDAGLMMTPLNVSSQNHNSPINDNKTTGAKPKRLSTTFSSTSSTSSKNSSKSRHSLRSTLQQPTTITATASNLCRIGFDDCERSVSCSEFRTERERDVLCGHTAHDSIPVPMAAARAAAPGAIIFAPTTDTNSLTENACLDCLEKEFLASTIGKSLDTQRCVKCHKHFGSNSLLQYQRNLSMKQSPLPTQMQTLSQSQQQFKRSASPITGSTYLSNNEQLSPQCRLFSGEFLNTQARKREEWDSYLTERLSLASAQSQNTQTPNQLINCNYKMDVTLKDKAIQQQNILKNFQPILTVSTVTIPTKNLSEVQVLEKALDELHVAYNKELLQKHFNSSLYSNSTGNISTGISPHKIALAPEMRVYSKVNSHKDLLQFLMHMSKSTGDYGKLKRLIEKITQSQVAVQYKTDTSSAISKELEMVRVNVSHILLYWSLDKNLEQLKRLDQRFTDHNILGKIANIIRQSYQRGPARRPLPEFISIPQYYPNGYLTLIKKC